MLFRGQKIPKIRWNVLTKGLKILSTDSEENHKLASGVDIWRTFFREHKRNYILTWLDCLKGWKAFRK